MWGYYSCAEVNRSKRLRDCVNSTHAAFVDTTCKNQNTTHEIFKPPGEKNPKSKVTRMLPFLGKLDAFISLTVKPANDASKKQRSSNRKWKNAEGKTEVLRRVSVLDSGGHPVLTAQTQRGDSSKGYAPSPLDFLCHPEVPGGREKDRVREERRQEDPSITGEKQRDVRGAEAPAGRMRQTIRTG